MNQDMTVAWKVKFQKLNDFYKISIMYTDQGEMKNVTEKE